MRCTIVLRPRRQKGISTRKHRGGSAKIWAGRSIMTNHRTAPALDLRQALDAACAWRRLHDPDRQFPIRLDPVCRADAEGARLGYGRNPDRVLSIFVALETPADPAGRLARRLARRATRTAFHGDRVSAGFWWRSGGRQNAYSGARWGCSISAAALTGTGAGAIYGDLRGQRGEMVSGPPGTRGRADPRPEFGAGAALTVIPIRDVIASSGYEMAFLVFGVGAQGAPLGAFILAWFLRAPEAGEVLGAEDRRGDPDVAELYAGRRCWRPRCSWLLDIMCSCSSRRAGSWRRRRSPSLPRTSTSLTSR